MPQRLPKNSCDTAIHVFGDLKRYPVNNPNALYQPPQDCTIEAAQRMHETMGVDRAVLVQPTVYGCDNRLLHDVLESAPKGRYCGVAIIDDSVSDAELQRLHDVGVRGARFNFGGAFKLSPSLTTLRRSLARINELGWFAKMFGFNDDFLPVEAELRKVQMPAIIDHLGGVDFRRGPSQPAVRLILDLLARDNWWIGLSNGDLFSHAGYPWDDAVEFGRLFYRAAPDRCMWGTDWPHVHRFIHPDKDGPSDYGVEHQFARLTLLERSVPDQAARDRVLVDNPARFFGFA